MCSTKIDQKYAPDPMGGVPGPEICKECNFWYEILHKLGLGTSYFVFELIFDRFCIRGGQFDGISFRMQWNRSQGSKN